MAELKIDKNCIPYPRKGIYWIITLPYLALLLATTVYLWNYSVSAAIAYFSFYIFSTALHGYICSFSECPYKGTLCPGAFGWFPVGKIAGVFKKTRVKNDKLIDVLLLVIMISILGILVLPIYWISKLGIIFSIAYVICIIVNFFSFVIFVCPNCAGRSYCPTAKLSNMLNKKMFNKNILG